MAELLVRVTDKPRTGDPRKDCQRSGRGDVIVAQPDGAYWSRAERSNPDWLILKVPGMTLAEGVALTAAEPVIGTKQRGPANRYRHRRLFRLDVTALIGPHPGRRVCEVKTLTLAAVRAVKQQKPAVKDPAVLGSQTPVYVLG